MGDYEIGYGKPPEETRFRKGQSGNSKGRPKGTRNFKTDLREALAKPVTVREAGRADTISSQRAALLQLRNKALTGDVRALDQLLALAERYDLEDSADETEQTLSVTDQQILERFTASVILEHEAEKVANKNDADAEPEE